MPTNFELRYCPAKEEAACAHGCLRRGGSGEAYEAAMFAMEECWGKCQVALRTRLNNIE